MTEVSDDASQDVSSDSVSVDDVSTTAIPPSPSSPLPKPDIVSDHVDVGDSTAKSIRFCSGFTIYSHSARLNRRPATCLGFAHWKMKRGGASFEKLHIEQEEDRLREKMIKSGNLPEGVRLKQWKEAVSRNENSVSEEIPKPFSDERTVILIGVSGQTKEMVESGVAPGVTGFGVLVVSEAKAIESSKDALNSRATVSSGPKTLNDRVVMVAKNIEKGSGLFVTSCQKGFGIAKDKVSHLSFWEDAGKRGVRIVKWFATTTSVGMKRLYKRTVKGISTLLPQSEGSSDDRP